MNENQINRFDIAQNFQIEGKIVSIEPYGSGHIQETSLLKNESPELPDYIMQKINTNIFGKVEELMNNICYVTNHLRTINEKIYAEDVKNRVMTVIHSTDGKTYYKDDEGGYWRVFLFINGSKSYDLVETRQQAYEGGRAYGLFQIQLADLDAKKLYETLPKFHNLQYRLDNLEQAISQNPAGRLEQVSSEINFVKDKSELMLTILRMANSGKLPLKTTHNDTKFNNVLLDRNDHAQCVIDLDTVMPGYVAYDFGDAIRTIVNTAVEDEKNLEKINVNMELFDGFADGFLKEAGDSLNDYEIESLAHGCLLLPFLMAVRFLTDYIDGDNYYKISFPEHNLQRARAQIRLTERLIEKFPDMKKIIDKYSTTKNRI